MRYFHPPCLTKLSRLSEPSNRRWRSHCGTLSAVWEWWQPATNWRQYSALNIRKWRSPAKGSCYVNDATGIWTVNLLNGMKFLSTLQCIVIQRKFIKNFRSLMFQFTVPSSVGQYQVQTHIVSAKSCEMHSLLTAVTTATASDAEGKTQRCQTCDLRSEYKLRSPTNDVTYRKKFLVRCTPNPSFTP
jgi:hypothetical protein